MIKHVIFDLGNVIVNVHPERAMKTFVERSRVPETKIQEFYLSELHLDFMRGKYSPDDFYNSMSSQYQFDLSMNDFFSIWNQVIGEPKGGITQLIQELGGKFALSICSNTDQVHWNYCLEHFAFLQQFEHYFLSFEMKLNKPDLEVFEKILAALRANGEECVFIDDTLANVEAARNYSILGIHEAVPEEIKQELLKLDLL